jgi:hypothetical protein
MARIDDLIYEGERLIRSHHFEGALAAFQAAWNELPAPADAHEQAIPILGAIVDCRFFPPQWAECRDAVQSAFRAGASLDDVFFRLRLGQSLYELGDRQEAANWLVPVYLMEGQRPFEEDSKYLTFFHDQLQPPPGGWPVGW